MIVDGKLARGLALAELRKLLRDQSPQDSLPLNDHRHPVGVAIKPIMWRYATGRLPDESFTDRVLGAIDAYFDGRPGSVLSQRIDSPETRLRSYVHVSASGTEHRPIAQVRFALLDVTPLYVTLRDRMLLEVTGHALERFHLRTRSGLRRNILEQIARASLSRLSLLDFIADFASVTENPRIAIPLEDGLALASFRKDVSRPLDIKLMQGIDREIYRDNGEGRATSVARIDTFIGPLEMGPNQVRLRDDLVALEAKWAKDLEFISRFTAKPEGTAREMIDLHRHGDMMKIMNEMDRIEMRVNQISDELMAVLEDESAQIAMGRHKPIADEDCTPPTP